MSKLSPKFKILSPMFKVLVFLVLIAGITTLFCTPFDLAQARVGDSDNVKKKENPDFGEELCPNNRKKSFPSIKRSKVYKSKPYRVGEVSTYELSYQGALVGTATMRVMKPYKYQGALKKKNWHQRFQIEAKTGDWYRYILVGRALVESWVRPWDGSAGRFYSEVAHGNMFGSQSEEKKWFEFDSANCKVNSRKVKDGKEEKKIDDFAYGGRDILSAVYWLREIKYTLKKTKRVMVHTSRKNWWLEVTPIAKETLKYKEKDVIATKLKLQSFIGDKLEQKGDLFVWIEEGTPERKMIKAEGEVKIGMVKIDLIDYKK